MTRNTYFISSPHTKEECLAALDAIAGRGADHLNQWYFGCQAGDHTGYALIQAESENEARDNIPDNLRNKARIAKVDQYTQQQIRQFHEMQPSQTRNR
jgi:hypothetical protein